MLPVPYTCHTRYKNSHVTQTWFVLHTTCIGGVHCMMFCTLFNSADAVLPACRCVPQGTGRVG